ncbi:hypothetical protein ACRRTK_020402 [Alexandromys fortis]
MRFPGPQAELSCAHSSQAHVKSEAAQTGSDWERAVLEQREPNVQGWETLLTVPSPCVKSVPIYFYICHRKCTFPGHKGVGVRVS